MGRAVRVVIGGRVQGVGYRAWCQTEAESLGLSGWVRNRREGSVEALFSGDAAAVEEMLCRVWRGPRGADIASVAVEEAGAVAGDRFDVLPTV
jgi:acylphosphatase